MDGWCGGVKNPSGALPPIQISSYVISSHFTELVLEITGMGMHKTV